MKVVIDTNVLWVSVSRRSASHWLFQAVLEGSLTLCVTTDILDEYAEIMSSKLGIEASEAVLSLFDNLPNIQLITRYYRWFAIKADADDDKFVDCAVAANAICSITEDKHFKVLKQLDFPKVKAMSINEFEGLYQK
ncbi:MAG: putative toxin-antitoxin system toxin component, PIN family [Emticicia sp.]